MPDFIGNIQVPEIVPSGTFPIVSEYPYGRSSAPDVVIHQFGSGTYVVSQTGKSTASCQLIVK